jgi:hypothetical protein
MTVGCGWCGGIIHFDTDSPLIDSDGICLDCVVKYFPEFAEQLIAQHKEKKDAVHKQIQLGA